MLVSANHAMPLADRVNASLSPHRKKGKHTLLWVVCVWLSPSKREVASSILASTGKPGSSSIGRTPKTSSTLFI